MISADTHGIIIDHLQKSDRCKCRSKACEEEIKRGSSVLIDVESSNSRALPVRMIVRGMFFFVCLLV